MLRSAAGQVPDPVPATAWVDQRLAAAGLARIGEIETLRERPWGTVMSAESSAGPVWFKAPGPAVAFEVPLYRLLVESAPGMVLEPIASDEERGWLLLPDGGESLGEMLEGDALVDALELALPRYAELQLAIAPRVDELIGLGIADMRPEAMAARFDEAIELVDGLLPRVGEPGDAETLELVAEGRSEFAEWCTRLADAPVPPSLDHNDLHRFNVLAGPEGDLATARFFDWGDSDIACPLASARAIGFVPGADAAAERLRDAYLEPFTALAPRMVLIDSLELACRVGKVARAHVWHRAVAPALDDAPATYLRGAVEALFSLLDDDWLGAA
jgi:hypothetical protein